MMCWLTSAKKDQQFEIDRLSQSHIETDKQNKTHTSDTRDTSVKPWEFFVQLVLQRLGLTWLCD